MPAQKKISATTPAARTGFARALAILFALACLYLATILLLSFAQLRDDPKPPPEAATTDHVVDLDREDSHAH